MFLLLTVLPVCLVEELAHARSPNTCHAEIVFETVNPSHQIRNLDTSFDSEI